MTSSTLISVIICTHNPRPDYLSRVLQALDSQTLSKDLWELLLIDNASEKILSTEIDISWHPNSRHIREEQLGLTPARLRGIKESQSEVLVFVDDDNVLDVDYLEVTLKISENYPFIGAWGGQIRAEFEETPAEWIKPYLGMLAIREFDRDTWSNFLINYDCVPCGAGLCIRRSVVEKYLEMTKNDCSRLRFGTNANNFFRCEDIDLVLTACDIGLGMGQFKSLRLLHLLPKNRLQESYLLKLQEGNGYSVTILESFRGKLPSLRTPTWRGKILNYYQLWKMEPKAKLFFQASKRGIDKATRELIGSLNQSN
jgi:glycosyltransferase involved in cell wall biosynthesis